jgi:uncharacterized protein (DUF58 family)
MISAEILEKVRRIRFLTRRTVSGRFVGEYSSAFKGHGIEFAEVREYVPGDDVRTIDWNVTAKTGYPHIKRYREERELTLFFLVDLSPSGSFGSTGETRNETAAEIVAALALAANLAGDRTGLAAFTDGVELFVPPAKGSVHGRRIVRDILAFEPTFRGTDIGGALEYTATVLRRRAVVFLISDFYDDPERYHRRLSVLAGEHDVISLLLVDPVEESLPPVGLVRIRDAESGALVLVDSGSRRVRERYAEYAAGRLQTVEETIRDAGSDLLRIRLGEDWVHPMTSFFQRREFRGIRR